MNEKKGENQCLWWDWNWGIKDSGEGGTQSCIWGNHNSTFTRLNDLTALERQWLWPSCKIPISWVCATVEMKRGQGLYRAPGLSDYCLKTSVSARDKESTDTEGAPSPSCSRSLRTEESEELISSPPACLFFFFFSTLRPFSWAYVPYDLLDYSCQLMIKTDLWVTSLHTLNAGCLLLNMIRILPQLFLP